MTQPPIPYSLPQIPPTGYWLGPADALLAPARRASWLMIALGALALCCGVCLISAGVLLFQQFVQKAQVDPAVLDQLGMTKPQFCKAAVIAMSSILVIAAFAFLSCGAMVRRGGLGWIIVAMIVAAGSGLLLLVQLIGSAIAIIGKGDPGGFLAIVVFGGLLMAMGLLFYWLIQAARATVPLKQMQLQQQQQWYAMQQQYFASQR